MRKLLKVGKVIVEQFLDCLKIYFKEFSGVRKITSPSIKRMYRCDHEMKICQKTRNE